MKYKDELDLKEMDMIKLERTAANGVTRKKTVPIFTAKFGVLKVSSMRSKVQEGSNKATDR